MPCSVIDDLEFLKGGIHTDSRILRPVQLAILSWLARFPAVCNGRLAPRIFHRLDFLRG